MPVSQTMLWLPDEINGIPTLYWILILSAAIVGFLILFFIIYYIIYKIRINIALKKEKHIGKPLISPLGIVVASGAVVWIGATVFIIAMLHLLISFSAQNSQYISDNYRNIISLQQEIFMDKITNNYTFSLGEINAKSKTVGLTVELDTSLVLGKGDKLTFRIGDSETELQEKESGHFTGSVDVSIWKEAPSGILTFESGDDRITQILSSGIRIFKDYTDQPETIDEGTWTECCPYADYDTSHIEISSEGDKTRIDGDMTVLSFPSKADKDIVFTEMTLVFEVNGRIFRKIDLMKDSSVKHDDNSYTCTLNEAVEKGEIAYYLLATDSVGCKYKLYNNNNYILNSEDYENQGSLGAFSTVYDKDGKIIKEFIA